VPTYQYACTACGHRLEAVQSFTDEPLTECPTCEGKLRKVFNSVGIVFKGSGFYRTDSRPGGSESSSGGSTSTSSSSAKSDSASSNGGSGEGSSNGSANGSAKPAATAGTSSATSRQLSCPQAGRRLRYVRPANA
jgi:putative FmdB family regulatory protein